MCIFSSCSSILLTLLLIGGSFRLYSLKELLTVAVRALVAEEAEKTLLVAAGRAELEALVDRWEVAQLVDRGVPYRQIQQTTNVSTATITRVARALVHGAGGYRRMIDRIQGKTS